MMQRSFPPTYPELRLSTVCDWILAGCEVTNTHPQHVAAAAASSKNDSQHSLNPLQRKLHCLAQNATRSISYKKTTYPTSDYHSCTPTKAVTASASTC